jgi:hypothetical protein
VGRWSTDCGCKIDPAKSSQQAWRAPLREALTWLAAQCHTRFDLEAPALLADPAGAIDGYGAVLGLDPAAIRAYAERKARPGLAPDDLVRAAELLELERGALRSLTSCAWFFDDIGGVEALQGLRYAAWAIAQAGPEARRLEDEFAARLASAHSNAPTLGTGQDIYLRRARPHSAPEARVAAGLAAARRFAPASATSTAYELVSGSDGDVLARRRTGRRFPFRAQIEPGNLTLEVTVQAPWAGDPISYALDDLPERQRSAVGLTLRERALARLLTDNDRRDLGRGEALREVIRRALLRATSALGRDQSDEAQGRVTDLVTILEQLGQAVPFEVQTVFYRIWTAGPSRPAMTALAARLGFERD